MGLMFGKIKCGICKAKVKDKDLAKIHIKCEDGIVKRKICHACEETLNNTDTLSE